MSRRASSQLPPPPGRGPNDTELQDVRPQISNGFVQRNESDATAADDGQVSPRGSRTATGLSNPQANQDGRRRTWNSIPSRSSHIRTSSDATAFDGDQQSRPGSSASYELRSRLIPPRPSTSDGRGVVALPSGRHPAFRDHQSSYASEESTVKSSENNSTSYIPKTRRRYPFGGDSEDKLSTTETDVGRGGRSRQEGQTPLPSDNRSQPQAGSASPPDQGQDRQSSQANQSRQSGQQRQRQNRKNEEWGNTSREPHYDSDKMREKPGTRKGALFRYHATQAEFYALPVAPGSEEVQLIQGEHWVFSSRDSRKGRHAVVVRLPRDQPGSQQWKPTNDFKGTMRTIGNMFYLKERLTELSYWVFLVFLVGSILWIITSIFSLLPLFRSKELPEKYLNDFGTVTGLVGSIVFQVGAVLLIFESFNDGHLGCYPRGKLIQSEEGLESVETKWETEKPNCVNTNRRIWGNRIPWPTKQSFKDHYWYNMGFLAALCQNIGSIIFFSSNLLRYKGLYAHLTTRAQKDGAIWGIKIVACVLFIYSGLLNIWETQPKRTKLRPDLIGWWVGVFKVVGAIFFVVCSAFGILYVQIEKKWAAIASASLALAGSSCFLLASLLLGFECSQPTPTVVIPLSDDEAQQYYQDRDNAAQANVARDGAPQQDVLEMSGALDRAAQSNSAQLESPQNDGARPRSHNARDGNGSAEHIENGTSQGPQRHEARAWRRWLGKQPERREQQTKSALEQLDGTGPSYGHKVPPLPELEAPNIG